MRFNVRDLVYIGVFGALWGAIELSLGSVLHMLNVPFSGALLSALGIAIALIGRTFVPARGSILFIGAVAAILKVFSIGSVVLSPVFGILMEALIAELVLAAFARPGLIGFMAAGGPATLWTLFHPFVTWGIVGGQGLITIYERTISKAAGVLGLTPAAGLLILAFLIVLHLGLGAVGGWLAWMVGHVAQMRLQPEGTQ